MQMNHAKQYFKTCHSLERLSRNDDSAELAKEHHFVLQAALLSKVKYERFLCLVKPAVRQQLSIHAEMLAVAPYMIGYMGKIGFDEVPINERLENYKQWKENPEMWDEIPF